MRQGMSKSLNESIGVSILDADGRPNVSIDVSGSMSSSYPNEEIKFEVVFNESIGLVDLVPLDSYTKELFECLIEEEISAILKPYLNYAMTGYIKLCIKSRLEDYLIRGF